VRERPEGRLRIVTWNVNSIRMRLARARQLLVRQAPDLLCLQELKVAEDAFPAADLGELGYRAAVHAQAGRNGVAILSRAPLDDVANGFPGDPLPEQARVVAGTLDGLRVIDVYVVNGKAVGTPEYEQKLAWLDALVAWLRTELEAHERCIIVGDFNVAPDDRDVHDPDRWRGSNLCSDPERDRIRALLDLGFVDLMRVHEPGPGPFTWWDYREGAFHRGWGLRLDLAFGTRQIADRCTGVVVERDERKPTFGEGKPSDHAPVIVTLT
jgi:exodeoxyribonuclease III